MNHADNFPNHVAIIMDGNGRWAKKRNRQRTDGHAKGAAVAIDTVLCAKKVNIKYLTLFAFSAENWNRPKREIALIFSLVENYLKNKATELKENGIRFKTIGNLGDLPKSTADLINMVSDMTSGCADMVFTLAISYGGRQEIQAAAERYKNSGNPIKFDSYIQSAFLPDPDLLIRTGGEKRISNFMLYGLAYTELYFLDKYWPDFSCEDLKAAIKEYKLRKRRFGDLI
ncbi:MAG: di-trans,poly-cis-decaprenylcistransferase [Epsilonproteobacteria bacterium]|nr:di-trans,poly-cis-decaprenylcistransferase [Campylobacterota bacterium]